MFSFLNSVVANLEAMRPKLLLLLFFFYLHSPNLGFTPPPGTYNLNTRGSDAYRGATVFGPEYQTDTQGRASPNVCGQHNVSASAEDNTGQNTDKGHTPYPRTEIKIADPAGNRTHGATATDETKVPGLLINYYQG